MTNQNNSRLPSPQDRSTPISPSGRYVTPESRRTTNEAAANIARSQINSIFGIEDSPNKDQPPADTQNSSATRTQTADTSLRQTNPKDGSSHRTIQPLSSESSINHAQSARLLAPQENAKTNQTANKPTEDQWKQYHSAWQQYYQQYYYRYYSNELQKNMPASARPTEANNRPKELILTEAEAVNDLRSQLRNKVRVSAKKARKSIHFWPIVSAATIMLAFVFLQYNRPVMAAVQSYVSPGNLEPANIIPSADPTVKVGPNPELIIPKINVQAPIVFGVSNNHDEQMKALNSGVAHLTMPGANSMPGQVGNTVIYGHSSNDVLDSGQYNFVFVRLDKLQNGDIINVNYNSVRYTYTVSKMEVVKPTDVEKLVYQGDKPILTLITCAPIGTDISRLLVTAEQISPDPNQATAKNEQSASVPTPDPNKGMPGGEKSFLEKIFNLNFS